MRFSYGKTRRKMTPCSRIAQHLAAHVHQYPVALAATSCAAVEQRVYLLGQILGDLLLRLERVLLLELFEFR